MTEFGGISHQMDAWKRVAEWKISQIGSKSAIIASKSGDVQRLLTEWYLLPAYLMMGEWGSGFKYLGVSFSPFDIV